MSISNHNRDVLDNLLNNIGLALEQKIRSNLLREDIPAWVNLEDNIYDSINHELKNGVLTVGSNSPHGPFVEYGRKPGKAPPFDPIYQWVRNKITSEEPRAHDLAFAIQHKIAEKGVNPKRFMFKAVSEFVSSTQ